MKYSFKNDYSEGAHPRILEAIVSTNLIQQDGYGEDLYCQEARALILKSMASTSADIHFVSGGTQANLIVISTILRPHESVIAVETGHINVHETGAIEATGHKVCVAPSADGKLTPDLIRSVVNGHPDEHMVKPKLAYISNATEIGTIYTKEDLLALRETCNELGLYLFMDGARLGSALCSRATNLQMSDLKDLVDVFYIGGTKNGALLGEAIVINNPALQADFRYMMKQRGALLAKGRLLGIQFRELFKDDLLFDLAKHANKMAFKISDRMAELGYNFLGTPQANLFFPILPNTMIEKLHEKYGFYANEIIDADHTAVRIVTSWATPEAVVNAFIQDIETLTL